MDFVINNLEQNCPDDPEFSFYCPACRCDHWFKTTGERPVWTWNKDYEKPTISPSIVSAVRFNSPENPDKICHFFVVNGEIQYLADCTHDMAGQTVPMVKDD